MGSRTTPKQPPRARSADPPRRADPARAAAIAARLAELWPDAVVELDHRNAYELLVATILAAQSTDRLINTVTPALFAKYPTPSALARADQAELERMIFSTGFYRMKARHLIGMAQRIVERHGGEVPQTMDGLIDLPGVARKTANVVLGSALGKNEGIVVDTHVSRLAQRLGLTTQTDPVKIEQDLIQLLPREQWSIFAHRLIWHGRRVCHAKQPDCEHCALAPLCPSAGLAATPRLMPPRNGEPPPPSRAQRARAAEARAGQRAGSAAANAAPVAAGRTRPAPPTRFARTGRTGAPLDRPDSAKLGSKPGSTLGSKLAGSKLGSKLVGSKLGSKLRSKLAGSKLRSKLAGSKLAGSKLAGSKLVGSKLAGSKLRSKLAGSRPAREKRA
jgi:endonuclease-3